MKKIIPFSKEISFKTMVSTITSISLENTLKAGDNNVILGDFIVSGTYKMTEASQIDEEFSYKIPVEIQIDNKYLIDNVNIEIDDFTYEILDEEVLKVDISLLIDNLEEKEISYEQISDEEIVNDRFDTEKDDDLFVDDSKQEKLEFEKDSSADNITIDNNHDTTKTMQSLFTSFKDNVETFKTYTVYIVKENDTLDSIISKYNTDKELLEEYNDLSDIRVGNKIIIPCGKNE